MSTMSTRETPATKRYEEIGRQWNTYRRLMPEIADAYDPLPEEVYKDGLISGKHKRLMALVAALVAGCEACILFQCQHALQVGASGEEILEACAVAVSLGGTMGAGQTARVVALLEEQGVLPQEP